MEDDEEVVIIGMKPIASFSGVEYLQWRAGKEQVDGPRWLHECGVILGLIRQQFAGCGPD